MCLSNNEIHIYFLDLKTKIDINALMMLLSYDERERSSNFAFPHLKNRFIITRAVLKVVLSHYIKIPSRNIKFCYGKYGKPGLLGENNVKFNLSHSGEWVVYAISFNDAIGVDIEEIKESVYSLGMEKLCLSRQERRDLELLPFSERLQVFYSLWAYKEALLKGLGYGLNYPLTELEIDISDELFPKIHSNDFNLQDWSLCPLSCPNNFKGAVAVESKEKKIVYRRWQDLPMMAELLYVENL